MLFDHLLFGLSSFLFHSLPCPGWVVIFMRPITLGYWTKDSNLGKRAFLATRQISWYENRLGGGREVNQPHTRTQIKVLTSFPTSSPMLRPHLKTSFRSFICTHHTTSFSQTGGVNVSKNINFSYFSCSAYIHFQVSVSSIAELRVQNKNVTRDMWMRDIHWSTILQHCIN